MRQRSGGCSAASSSPLHSASDRFAGLVEAGDYPPARCLADAASEYADVAEHVPAAHRAAVERFLSGSAPALVFSHNDLGIEHALVDGGAVVGIIDWSDAAFADPAYDLGLIYRDLGPVALSAALAAYGDTSLRERVEFIIGRCRVFEALEFAVSGGRAAYLRKCLSSMDWLFPAG